MRKSTSYLCHNLWKRVETCNLTANREKWGEISNGNIFKVLGKWFVNILKIVFSKHGLGKDLIWDQSQSVWDRMSKIH